MCITQRISNGVEQMIVFALVLLGLTYQAKSLELLMALASAGVMLLVL